MADMDKFERLLRVALSRRHAAMKRHPLLTIRSHKAARWRECCCSEVSSHAYLAAAQASNVDQPDISANSGFSGMSGSCSCSVILNLHFRQAQTSARAPP